MKKTLLLNYLVATPSRNPRKNTTLFNGLLTLFIMVMGMGVSWGQTNPAAQSLPYTQNFGTSTFTTMPVGMVAWTGGANRTTQTAAEGGTPGADAAITAATSSQTGGGVYGYAAASNARAYIQQSSNATNGTNTIAVAINTGAGVTSINLSYQLELINAGVSTQDFGLGLQYRAGTSGSWTTITESALTFGSVSSYTTSTLNYNITGLTASTVYQIRWITWRPTGTGNSKGIGIDNISITAVSSSNSSASDIISQSGYSYTSNIDYATKQTASTLTIANSVGVNGLTLRDGGATTDADALGTTLTDITFSTGGSTAIRTAALFDGTNKIAEVAVNGATSIVFTGLSLSATDGGTKDFELRVTYQSTVTDNQQITFTVSSATASTSTSSFATANAGAAASNSTGDNNRIEVFVSRLVFSQQPTDVNTNVSMSPAVTVTAKDANNNNDLDFTDNIRVSSTGTMTGSPVSVAAVNGIATFNSLTHTNTGTGLTLLAERDNSGSWDLDVTSNPFSVAVVSTATDYFRSLATGSWASPSSWESSVDGTTNWITATLTPTSSANTITIRNGHTITNSTVLSIDQVTVESGGILTLASGGVATIVNGAGDDIIIQNGGRINYQFAPTYSSSTIRINSGGVLSVEVAGVTGAGSGVNASTHIYDDASILQWNIPTASISGSGVTFFPNVTTEIPILRFSSITQSSWGGSSQTVVNGKVEIATGITITLASSGIKTFKYGVTGAGTLNQSSAGQIIFSGVNSEISGTATLNLGINGLSVTGNLNVSGTLSCGTNSVSGAGTFTLASGGKLVSGNSTGLNGSITVGGSKILSNAANYEFNGSAQQVTGTLMPSTINNLIINNSTGVSLSQSTTLAGTLTQTLGKLTIGSYSLTLNGSYSGSATNSLVGSASSNLNTTGTTGTLYFDQTTPGTTNVLKNLTISSGTVTLGNTLNIIAGSSSGTVLVGTGATLTTGDFLTLKSDANGTANVGNSAGTISGNVTVERFIPSGKRAFRLLSPAVTTSNFISGNWQQQTHITGGASGGFDITETNNPSMYTYNNQVANGTGWEAIANTNATNLAAGVGYRMLVRGDRTPTNITAATTDNMNAAITLSATGILKTGTVTLNASSTPAINNTSNTTTADYSLVGNPYQSAVDWNAVTKNGIEGTYYAWDPNMGTTGVQRGRYVVFNGTTNDNVSSQVGRYIQPGQAFFVKNTVSGTAGTLTFQEAHKASTNANVFRTANQTESANFASLSMQLYNPNELALGGYPIDATKAVFSSDYTNEIGLGDATKLEAAGENIAWFRNNTKLAIDAAAPVTTSDELVLKTLRLGANKNYTFKIQTTNFDTALTPYLVDNFLNTQTEITTSQAFLASFATTSNVASYSENRFKVVFSPSSALSNDQWDAKSLNIYPNPVVDNQFTIGVSSSITDKVTITIYNIIGQSVYKVSATPINNSILVQPNVELKAGVYMVEMTNKGKTNTQKIIVK